MWDIWYGVRIEEKVYKGVGDVIRRILVEEGLKGFYKGILFLIVKVVFNLVFIFYVYEFIKYWLMFWL